MRGRSMTGEQADAAHRAQDLREAFDNGFARAPEPVAQDAEKLLAIRIGNDPYAVALAEITGIFVDRKIVPLPGKTIGLLGVAGLRGDILPVYSLAVYLGYSASDDAPRWLMRTGRDLIVAFAFDAFDGYVQLPRAQISSTQDNAQNGHVCAMALLAEGPRPVISIASIVKKISDRIDSGHH
jgi:purine-binding chemotaxis protein CheW